MLALIKEALIPNEIVLSVIKIGSFQLRRLHHCCGDAEVLAHKANLDDLCSGPQEGPWRWGEGERVLVAFQNQAGRA